MLRFVVVALGKLAELRGAAGAAETAVTAFC